MKRDLTTSLMTFILAYILLAAYFNLLPILVPMGDAVRVAHMILFFPIAYGVSRMTGGRGLEKYGVVFFLGWKRNIGLGVVVGFLAWAVLFLLDFMIRKYEYTGVNINSGTPMLLLSIIVGYGMGSFINDMIVRGLAFNHFRGELPGRAIFAIALVLYALDDVWYAGFSLQNTIFSLALGLGLTYAYYKTNSVWASAGVHFGLNAVYGLFFGITGNSGEGLFIFTSRPEATFLSTWLSTFISLLLFFVIYRGIRFFNVYR